MSPCARCDHIPSCEDTVATGDHTHEDNYTSTGAESRTIDDDDAINVRGESPRVARFFALLCIAYELGDVGSMVWEVGVLSPGIVTSRRPGMDA